MCFFVDEVCGWGRSSKLECQEGRSPAACRRAIVSVTELARIATSSTCSPRLGTHTRCKLCCCEWPATLYTSINAAQPSISAQRRLLTHAVVVASPDRVVAARAWSLLTAAPRVQHSEARLVRLGPGDAELHRPHLVRQRASAAAALLGAALRRPRPRRVGRVRR